MKKISDIFEKEWGEDLERRGVFDNLCGYLIHTRGFGGMPGPITCAEVKPCPRHDLGETNQKVFSHTVHNS